MIELFRSQKAAAVVLVLVIGCVAHATHAFETDKLYKYTFEGAITSKVAEDDRPQYAGVALTSPVALRKSGPDELTVHLERPQSAVFNELMHNIHNHKFAYRPIENAAGLDKPFRIYFDESGGVKSFDAHKDEPKWVTNFKRGLLSFFQLKLKADQTSGADDERQYSSQYYVEPEKSVFGECDTDYLVISQPDDNRQSVAPLATINVTKTRNMARCKTRFMHRFMGIDSSECYDTEKDLQQYKHSNAIFQFELEGTRKEYTIKQVLVDEVARFSPFGQRAHGHIIQSKFLLKLDSARQTTGPAVDESDVARLESLSYDPPELVNFYANVNLDQEHHLASILQSSATVDQVMAVFEQLMQEHRGYTSAFETSAASQQERSRMAEKFSKLNELVGTLNTQKIEQLYAQVDDRGDSYKKIFWDLMSITGTNPSFVFTKRLISDGEAPAVKIKDFLTRLSYHIKMPSKSLFDEYVSLCKLDKIQSNTQYKRLCSLPLASLIHQHCAKPHAKYLRTQQEGANATVYKKAQNTCQIATAEEYYTRLVTPWGAGSSGGGGGGGGAPGAAKSGSASSGQLQGGAGAGGSVAGSVAGGASLPAGAGSSPAEDMPIGDKMFNIKMAGELGVRPSIEFLSGILASGDEHPVLRAAAMWQLNKAAHIYPNHIKRIVLPYYYDRGELLEVRIGALFNWLKAGMSLHEMETLAKQLLGEPSRQLVVYVHSLMASMADNSAALGGALACAHHNDRNARLVLKTIKRALDRHTAPSITDSHATMSSTWLDEFGYGAASVRSIIFANDSMAPTSLYLASSEIMSGLRLTPWSVSIQAHNLDKLVKRVAGVSGLLADKESLLDVFSLKRRSKRQVAADLIKQEAQEIDKELKLAAREFGDVYLAVTVSAYGRPIMFIDKDSRELKKMLSDDGTVKVPQIKKLLHSFNNHTTQQMMVTFEKFEVFNNELGLPLYQSISDFDYKTFKLNTIKMDVEPGFFREERQFKPPSRFAVALDAKLGRHNEMLVSSGSIVHSCKRLVGVGFHKKKLTNIPLKMSIEANLTGSQLTIKRQPIHNSLVYIKQTPVTFVRSFDATKMVSAEQDSAPANADEWRTLYNFNRTAEMQAFKLEYMTPLAIGLKLEGKHRAGEDWSLAAWRRHMSKVGLSAAKMMYFYSPSGKPLEVRLSTVTTDDNPTRELSYVFGWRHNSYASDSTSSLSDVERELEQTTGGAQAAGRPSTVSYKIAIVGGTSKERRVGLDLSYSRSFDRLLHKWRAFYSRTPLDGSSYGADVTNLCWLGQLQFPKHDAARLLNFDLLDMDHSANLTSELTFGDECQPNKQAASSGAPHTSAQVKFDWSQEQRDAINSALRGLDDNTASGAADEAKQNEYASMYKECLGRRQQGSGSKLDAVCVGLLKKIGELTHVSAQFDYKDVPERWTTLVRRLGSLYTYARAGYIEQIDDKPHGRDYKSTDGTKDRAHLEANLTSAQLDSSGASERRLSYEFDTPNYHVMYRNVPINVPALSTFPLLGSSFYQQLQQRASRVSCLVSNRTVQTFDNYTYTMPQVGDGCFKLVAKDCSPEANFAVLGARVGASKVVKVYMAQKFKVEFVPDKQASNKVSDIKVNGETVQIEHDKPALRRDTKLGPRTVEAFTIDYNGAYYTLNSKLYKFSVSTDGSWILVQQSKYYAGKSCGICGDANGERVLEFKAPSSAGKVCKNADDFVWSYVLPSTCATRPSTVECAA